METGDYLLFGPAHTPQTHAGMYEYRSLAASVSSTFDTHKHTHAGMYEYRSLAASVSSTFEFFIGSYDVDRILLLSPNLGSFYTISFDFLINVLLAILVDYECC